jgi:hypothetical protein
MISRKRGFMRKHVLIALTLAALGSPLAGQSGGRGTFIAPMGEPFRGEDPIGMWFAATDSDHDGALTLVEMDADAARFFATLDVNHDGEIDPTEMERYENEVAPETHQLSVTAGGGFGGGNRFRGGGRGGRHGGGMHGAGMKNGGPGGRDSDGRGFGGRVTSLLGMPEPVAAADENFNRGVSLPEFRKAAAQRFLLLDANHDGKLSRDELVPFRQQRAPIPAAEQPMHEPD